MIESQESLSVRSILSQTQVSSGTTRRHIISTLRCPRRHRSSDSSLLSSSPPTWFALPLPIPLAVAAAEDDGSIIPLAPWVSPAVVSPPLAEALDRSPRDPNNLCALAFSSFGC